MRRFAGALRGHRKVKRGEVSKAQMQDWLTNWFVARGKIGNGAPETLHETDYFEAGWLTSMEVVEFVIEIEQRFGMQFSDRDLQDPRFVTIAGLTELILERSTEISEKVT
jgi:acyl carrier protein